MSEAAALAWIDKNMSNLEGPLMSSSDRAAIRGRFHLDITVGDRSKEVERLQTLGVDGHMISPAYSYAAVMTKEIFMSREEIREKFRQANALLER